jgi:hypothetical protein
LEAENARLQEFFKGPDPHYDMARENGNLRAENERLRAALEKRQGPLQDFGSTTFPDFG